MNSPVSVLYIFLLPVSKAIFFPLSPAVLHAELEMAVSSREQIAIIIANFRQNLFCQWDSSLFANQMKSLVIRQITSIQLNSSSCSYVPDVFYVNHKILTFKLYGEFCNFSVGIPLEVDLVNLFCDNFYILQVK